jgi:hypothetical protein
MTLDDHAEKIALEPLDYERTSPEDNLSIVQRTHIPSAAPPPSTHANSSIK